MELGQWTTVPAVARSQSRAEPSQDCVSTRFPSGWKPTALTCWACPSSMAIGRRPATSQTSAVLTLLNPIASRSPRALQARALAGPPSASFRVAILPAGAIGPDLDPGVAAFVGDRDPCPVGAEREERRRVARREGLELASFGDEDRAVRQADHRPARVGGELHADDLAGARERDPSCVDVPDLESAGQRDRQVSAVRPHPDPLRCAAEVAQPRDRPGLAPAVYGDRPARLDARIAIELAVKDRPDGLGHPIEGDPAGAQVGEGEAGDRLVPKLVEARRRRLDRAGDRHGLPQRLQAVEALAWTSAEPARLGPGQVGAPELLERILPRRALGPPRLGRVRQLGIEAGGPAGPDDQDHGEERNDERPRDGQRRVAPAEPPAMLPGRITACPDRTIGKEATQVVRQLRGVDVAAPGSFAIAFKTIVSRSRGIRGSTRRGRGGSEWRIRSVSRARSPVPKGTGA